MGVTKTIKIDGREVLFKASAAIPRIYRCRFKHDIFKDLIALEKSIRKNENDIDIGSLETFENIAYIMAKHADPTIPESAEEWLDGFNTFSIYQVLPEIIELWGLNVAAEVSTKKNCVIPKDR